MQKPIAIMLNPRSGKKKGAYMASLLVHRLQEAGKIAQTFTSIAPGRLKSIASSLRQNDWSAVIVVGGDGSLFEVLNGLNSNKDGICIPVGHIPAGTGNSCLRDLGIFNLDDALDAILADRKVLVDLANFSCRTGRFCFINLLGAGFVSNVAKRSGKYKLFGSKSYILGVLEEVIHLDPVPVRLEIDGKVMEHNALFVEICNSRFTGGSMLIAPDASIHDGLLDVIVMKNAPRRRVLQLLPTIYSGSHVKAPEIEVYRGRRISIESERPMALTPDGEVFGSTPVDVGIENKILQIYGNERSSYADKNSEEKLYE